MKKYYRMSNLTMDVLMKLEKILDPDTLDDATIRTIEHLAYVACMNAHDHECGGYPYDRTNDEWINLLRLLAYHKIQVMIQPTAVMSKRLSHVSQKGNNVYCWDIVIANGKTWNVVCTVYSLNVAKRFCSVVEMLLQQGEEVDCFRLASLLHVVHHDARKLECLDSISTSCLQNPICMARRENPDSICAHCYAATQQQMQHGLNDNNALNYYILNNVLLPVEALATVPTWAVYSRIESFGDVASVTQARNYIRLIKAHPLQHFAIWSKNCLIWEEAFQLEGKPSNTTFVQSSLHTDRRDPVANEYVDHVFTVWSSDAAAAAAGVSINCGGRKCRTCLRCYQADTALYVDELLK